MDRREILAAQRQERERIQQAGGGLGVITALLGPYRAGILPSERTGMAARKKKATATATAMNNDGPSFEEFGVDGPTFEEAQRFDNTRAREFFSRQKSDEEEPEASGLGAGGFFKAAEEKEAERELRFKRWEIGEVFWCRWLRRRTLATPRAKGKKTAEVDILQRFDPEAETYLAEKIMTTNMHLMRFYLGLLDSMGTDPLTCIWRISYQGKRALPEGHAYAGEEAHSFRLRCYGQDAVGSWGELYFTRDAKTDEPTLTWDEPSRG